MIKRVKFDTNGNLSEVEFEGDITVQNAAAEIEHLRHRIWVMQEHYPVTPPAKVNKKQSKASNDTL